MEYNKNVLELKKALLKQKFDNALVQRSEDENGGYLVPLEQVEIIEQFKRKHIALKDKCRVIQTQSGKGQIPVEVEANMLLVAISEGEEIPQSQINFNVISWDVVTYADICPISRQILQDEACGLMEFVGARFAKKCVATENKKIIDAIVEADDSEIISSVLIGLDDALNIRLDPTNSENAVIICNQTYFNKLDVECDENGRGLLQPDLTQPTRKMFKGREVIVLSNADLELDGYIVGDLDAGVLFAEKPGVEIATSQQAGFTKNVVYARVITRFDVKLIDPKAVCVVKIG